MRGVSPSCKLVRLSYSEASKHQGWLRTEVVTLSFNDKMDLADFGV